MNSSERTAGEERARAGPDARDEGARDEGARDGGAREAGAPALNRRSFLQAVGLAGAGTVGLGGAAFAEGTPETDPYGILIDTTLCGGCRGCERACAEANGLPEPGDVDWDEVRRPSIHQLSVVDRSVVATEDGGTKRVFAKRQCMHCVEPACAAACLTKAMVKTTEGPVIWRANKCMGCRYCMIACPFDVPRFEYDSPIPRMHKCTLCWARLQEGDVPACADACPIEAIQFGRRRELLEESWRRITEEPERYVHHVYGEHEAGGTSALYLAAHPFEELGFPTGLQQSSYPKLTRNFLYSVPVALTVVPAFLLALSQATRRDDGAANEGDPDERSCHHDRGA